MHSQLDTSAQPPDDILCWPSARGYGPCLSQSISAAASVGAIDVDHFLESLESAGSIIFPKLLGRPEPVVPNYIAPTPIAAAVRKAKPALSNASHDLSLKCWTRSLTLSTAFHYLDQSVIDMKDNHDHEKMMLVFDFGGLEHEMMDLGPDITSKFPMGGSSGNVLKMIMTSSLC